jgi:cell division protein FtsI/penicillin-binding protein 2
MVRTHSRGAHAGKPAPLRGGPARGTRARGARAGNRRTGESRVRGVRPRTTRGRVIAAAGATVVLLIGLALGWASPSPSAEPTVQAFLLAWENGDYTSAAALTTGAPAVAVAAALESAYQQLGAADLSLSMGSITQHGNTADAHFNASVDLGRGSPPWFYTGNFQMRRIGGGWKVQWLPSVIVPGLRPGLRLAVLSTMPPRAQLLDAGGVPLAPRSRVYTVGVVPSRLTDLALTADRLSRATGLAANEIFNWIAEAPSAQFLELLQLSPAQYQTLRGGLARTPGLIIRPGRARLFNSIAPEVSGSVGTETAQVLQEEGAPFRPGNTVGLSGLQQTFQRLLVGTSTTEIVEENGNGQIVTVLKRWSGRNGTNVRTTIDSKVQLAADDAVASLPDSAAIVAVSASNGHVLAVAQHNAPGRPQVSALAGKYQPGQAFTIVSTAALLNSGLDLNTPIPCGVSNAVGGENFTNIPPEPNLGTFRSDFANACSTAFAGLSLRLDAKQLMAAATNFGLGASWRLPLSATSFTGSLRAPTNQAELAEETIGNGNVRVSPLNMALAAAVVQSGTWHPPMLVTSPPDPGLSPRVPFTPQVVSGLRTLMRSTVTSGAGQAANVAGAAVYGQVGSAPDGSGHWSSWFVGFQGNVAFAVVELTNSASVSAAPLAGHFLNGLKP